eukprot:2602011-Rhodomonas_salina.1
MSSTAIRYAMRRCYAMSGTKKGYGPTRGDGLLCRYYVGGKGGGRGGVEHVGAIEYCNGLCCYGCAQYCNGLTCCAVTCSAMRCEVLKQALLLRDACLLVAAQAGPVPKYRVEACTLHCARPEIKAHSCLGTDIGCLALRACASRTRTG